ncbi:MAG: T9SS type A sorting domain-containing protein [Bacteroidetes bacterium]|nr:T9SS type A sorting domain-containing protein [Bacteroidota bacterium]
MRKHLQARVLLRILGVAGAGYIALASALYLSNPPAGYTNASGENNCTSCHSGTLNPTQSNLSNMTISGNFTGGGYIPDSTYSITLSYSQSGINRFGFQITSLRTSNHTPAGDLTAGTGCTKSTKTINGSTRQYVSHTSSAISGSGGRSWTFTWKAPSSNIDTISFNAIVNAANGDNNETGDQIYAKEFKITPSSLLPTASVTRSKTQVCQGESITFFGSGSNNPTSYKWKFQSGSPQIVTTQNVVRTYPNLGIFSDTLWVTNSKGISKPLRILTQVVTKPNATITSSNASGIACTGDTIFLTANGGTGYRFVWHTVNLGDTFQTLAVLNSGSYKVDVINNAGCVKTSAPVNLTFQNPKVVGLSCTAPTDTICFGDSLMFDADTGYLNYAFYSDTTLLQSGVSRQLKIGAAGDYSVHVEAFDGVCLNKSSGTINKVIHTPLPAPVLQCGQASTDAVNLHWNPVPRAIGYEYSVNNAGFIGITDTFVHIGNLTYNTSVGVRVRAKEANNCSNGLPGALTCKSLPCSIFNFNLIRSDSLACEGDTVQLSIQDLTLNHFSTSFNGMFRSVDTLFDFIPTISNPYFDISIYDSLSPGCPPYSIHDSLAVASRPSLLVYYSKTRLCEGDTLSIHCSANFDRYLIFRSIGADEVQNTPDFVLKDAADGEQIYVQGQTAACSVNDSAVQIVVNRARPAGFTANGQNRDWAFVDTTSHTVKRIWWLGDSINTDTIQTVQYHFSGNGIYAVTLFTTDENACADSVRQDISSENVGLKEHFEENIRLYPNPSHGLFVIESQNAILRVQIFSLNGKRVLEDNPTSEKVTYRSDSMPPGTYLVKVSTYARDTVFMMVVE